MIQILALGFAVMAFGLAAVTLGFVLDLRHDVHKALTTPVERLKLGRMVDAAQVRERRSHLIAEARKR